MNPFWKQTSKLTLLSAACLLALTACGGGGGGGGGDDNTSGNLDTGVEVILAGGTLSFLDDEGDRWTYRKMAGGRTVAAVPSDLVGRWELIGLEGAPGPVNATNSTWTINSDGSYNWFFLYPGYFDVSGTGQWTLVGSTLYLDGVIAQTVLAGAQGQDSGCEVVVNAQGPAFLKIINTLGGEVDAEFQTLPLVATMRSGACELYGLPAGSHGVDYVLLSSGTVHSENHFLREGEVTTFRVEARHFQ